MRWSSREGASCDVSGVALCGAAAAAAAAGRTGAVRLHTQQSAVGRWQRGVSGVYKALTMSVVCVGCCAFIPPVQGVFGNIASVALGPDGHVWVLSRGGRVWTGKSFDAGEHIIDTEPIQANVVTQLHPDTGVLARSAGPA